MRTHSTHFLQRQFLHLGLTLAALSGHWICAGAASDFIPLSSLRLNGSAQLTNPTLITLTSDYYQAGSAFNPAPYSLGAKDNFIVSFTYQSLPPTSGAPADGLAFVAQNIGQSSAEYLGLSGSGLGFFTLSTVSAVGVTFDFYVNALTGTPAGTVAVSTPVGVNLAQTTPSLTALSGQSAYRSVWVHYNGQSKTLSVYYNNTDLHPATPLLTTVLPTPLSTLFGGQVYFGVTAGTGALYSVQKLNNFAVQIQKIP